MICDVEILHVTTGTWRYDSTWRKRAALLRAHRLNAAGVPCQVVDRLGRVVANLDEVSR